MKPKKYYIKNTFHSILGERFWFLIEDEYGLYTEFYEDDEISIMKPNKNGKTYLTNVDYDNNIKNSVEVSKGEWETEVFKHYL